MPGGFADADLSGGETEKREADEAALRDAQAKADMQDVLASPAGRRVLFDLLTAFGVFVPVFNNREAGAQQAGMLLRDRIKAAGIEYWHALLKENDR